MSTISLKINILGVANGTLKNVGLRKFWQDLEISEAFLISLEVSFLHGLFLLFLSLKTFYQRVSGSDFLTRISASRRVSDFTIRHPLYYLNHINNDYWDHKLFTVNLCANIVINHSIVL